jgi:glucosyl-dolichyl phosphate glucuronosyltransferase
MNFSIIIPTFNREKHLLNCLNSILNQNKLPTEVIVINNAKHDKAKDTFDFVKSRFDEKKIEIFYFNNEENSGAIARNLGVEKAKGDLIAFLDDDVVLDKNYYYEIEKVFINNDKALGVQGFDSGLNKSEQKINENIFNRWIYNFEKAFMISSFFERERSRVLPSLCVTIPYPNFNTLIQSEWISTCAGVFSKKVFMKFRFDSQLKKYSWNEYLDFSYRIFLENPKSLFVSPFARYQDADTNQGRLQPKELIYMSEVYDIYIFLKIFDLTFKNIFIYFWSKSGRLIYNIIRIIVRKPKEILLIFQYISALLFVLFNIKKIKKGNLNFFNKTLS